MSRLYEMATQPNKWPLCAIMSVWVSEKYTSGAEFELLNAFEAKDIPHLGTIIHTKKMTEEEIRMYMLFVWHACNDA